jgi:hypothetical protein
MEMPAKQTPAASSEMVKLLRKLRWVRLEEKAEELEKALEQLPATATVLATQMRRTSKGREPCSATFVVAPRIGHFRCRARPSA